MKRLFLLFLLIFAFTYSVFAQTAKKSSVGKEEKSSSLSSSPKLGTKEPSFAGFTGSFIKFGKISGGKRAFTMSVEYRPWFFEVSGFANAGHNTEDLDVLLEDIVAVVAYYSAEGKAADGTSYQAGLFDLMMYLEDDPVKVSDVEFTLIGKASSARFVLEQAKAWNFEPGGVFKMQKYSGPILKAQAASIDKSDLAREEAAAKKRVEDSISREKQKAAAEAAKAEKARKDSIAQVAREKKEAEAREKKEREKAEREKREMEKRKRDSIAEEKKRASAAKKKRVVEEDDYDEPPVKKKRKKPADDDDEPVKKKKKKRPVIEEDEEDDDPPVKKKKRRKST